MAAEVFHSWKHPKTKCLAEASVYRYDCIPSPAYTYSSGSKLAKQPPKEVKQALKSKGASIATCDTENAIKNLMEDVTLNALWRIKDHTQFIQGILWRLFLVYSSFIGTSPIEAINNILGAQKPRFTSKMSPAMTPTS